MAPERIIASHILGPVLTTSQIFSPTSGHSFSSTGAKFLLLHFSSSLEGADRLIVDLGYGTDEFTAASGTRFWTRPIKGDTVTITYIDDGDGLGSVTLDRFGRGEDVNQGGTAGVGNSDIFLLSSHYSNPPPRGKEGLCGGTPPTWQNVECLDPTIPAQAIMRNAARSVGMFVMVYQGTVSSCSAALIGPDLILTAAHCAAGRPDGPASEGEEVDSGSFTLDFQTDCSDNRVDPYEPRFYKMKRRIRSGFVRTDCDTSPPRDFAIIQIDTAGTTIPVPALNLRTTAPIPGEPVFGIHHPRGAPKKVSRPGPDPCIMTTTVNFSCDVDHGSSGSPVFDSAGNIIGVAVEAGCFYTGANLLVPTSEILADLAHSPPPCNPLSVVAVFDQSGSMTLPARVGDPKTKLQSAKEATAMFVDLLRNDAGDKIGLVPFSTTASEPIGSTLDFANDARKTTLLGSPPSRSGGVLGGLSADQLTSIGDGLRLAQDQLSADGSGNTPAILLMTDGLENTAPFIADVEGALASTKLCIVGFGTETSLDGPLLSRLARDHRGDYTRAGDGLQLKKFYTLCFGNIFANGSSMDPFYTIPAGATSFNPIPFRVCGETLLTVVIGWDNSSRHLIPMLETPGGVVINGGTPGVFSSFGDTWHYLRVSLPFQGEQNGTWKILLQEFRPVANLESFFASVLVEGGPFFRTAMPPRRYYTGDRINPTLVLREAAGYIPENATVTVQVTRPIDSVGNILTQSGLMQSTTSSGDPVDERTSTLLALENALGHPLIGTVTDTFPLFDDASHDDGALESDGVFANPLDTISQFEGTYTFRAVGRYGLDCIGTRETTWSLAVECGISSNLTTCSVVSSTNLPGGLQLVHLRIVPRDAMGNHLGPARLDAFTIAPLKGSFLTNAPVDLRNGSYVQGVIWNPSEAPKPGLILTQADRQGIALQAPSGPEKLQPPVVTIIGPTNGQTLSPDGSIRVRAVAFDPDGSVRHVEFFSDGALLGTLTNAPFDLLLTNREPLTLALTAVATDDGGLKSTSSVVSVTIAKNALGSELVAVLLAPERIKAQSNLTYTIIVRNDGIATATQVSLTDTVPPNTRFCGATPTQGSCILSDGVVRCDLGSLAPGASALATLVVVPNFAGTITNTVRASAMETDLNPIDDFANARTFVDPQDTVITVIRSGKGATISWNALIGVLQQTDNITGQWQDLPNSANPFNVDLSSTKRKFYRVRLN